MKQKNILKKLFLLTFVVLISAGTCFALPGTLKNVGNMGGIGDDKAYAVSVFPPGGDFIIAGQADENSIGTGNFDNLPSKGGIDGIIGTFNYDQESDNFSPGYVYNAGGADTDIFYAISYVNYYGLYGYCAMGEVGPLSFNNGDYFVTPEGGIDATLVTLYGDFLWNPEVQVAGTSGTDKIFGLHRQSLSGTNYMVAGTYNSLPMLGSTNNYTLPNTSTIDSDGTGVLRAITKVFKEEYDEVNDETYYYWANAAVGHADSATFNTGDWTGIDGKGGIDTIIAFADWFNISSYKNFGGAGNDYFFGTAGDDYFYYSDNRRPPVLNGDFIAVGSSSAATFNTYDWTNIDGKGGSDATIVRFNSDGEMVWQENFGGAGNDTFAAIAATLDGGFVVVGYSDAATFGDPNGDWAAFTGKGGIDAVIVKFDADGEMLWQKNFGGSDNDYFTAVAVKENGDVVATGYSNDGSFRTGDFGNITGYGGTDIIYAIFNDADICTLKYLRYANNKDLLHYEDHVISGDIIELPETPERLGFTFKGWYLNEKCTIPFNPSASVTADTILYPGWKATGSDVVISYNDGSGNYQDITKAYGSKVTLQAVDTGIPFAYWEDDEGKIRSYSSTYTFVAMESIQMTAVFNSTVPSPQPTVHIDKSNIITAEAPPYRSVSFFGDIVIPDSFTVISRGIIGSYYIPGSQYYDWNEDRFKIGATGVSRVAIPGTNSKVQATFNKVGITFDFCARTFLEYNDGTTNHTIYSDIAYFFTD